jgi:hypothetical protein
MLYPFYSNFHHQKYLTIELKFDKLAIVIQKYPKGGAQWFKRSKFLATVQLTGGVRPLTGSFTFL